MKNIGQQSFSGDRFEVIKILGEGGMGIVYEVVDQKLGSRLALKTIKEENSESLLMLKREFRSLQDLKHKNLISFGELFEDQGRWFFTMELIADAVDLVSYIRDTDFTNDHNTSSSNMLLNNFPSSNIGNTEPKALHIEDISDHIKYNEARLRTSFVQLCEGLKVLHTSGRLHRDIKPGNVMVDPNGRVIIMDFGLVTETQEHLKTMSRFFPVGTSAYMSPEQAANGALSPASDWYSVGVVLFQALTGKLPFEGNFSSIMLEKQTRKAPSPDEYVKNLPKDLIKLTNQLLSFDPSERGESDSIIQSFSGTDVSLFMKRSNHLSNSDFYVGREKELDLLKTSYEKFIGGTGVLNIIHGPSGLGKSDLIRTFLKTNVMHTRNTIILKGRCYEHESVPFKAVDAVIDALSQVLIKMPKEDQYYVTPQDSAYLTRVFPVLNRVESMSMNVIKKSDREDPQEIRSLAFGALRELFKRISNKYKLVVYIDDFQWADDDSLKLLRSLFKSPGAPVVFLVFSHLTEGSGSLDEQDFNSIYSIIPGEKIMVPVYPLSEKESVTLAEKLFEAYGVSSKKEFLDVIAKESGGYPLFISELVKHISSLSGRIPENQDFVLENVLWERISSLEPESRKILETICISTVPVSLEFITEINNSTSGAFMRLISELRISGLLRSSGRKNDWKLEPHHERVRRSVLENLSPEVLKQWHRIFAKKYKQTGNHQPDILAYHYHAAEEYKLARYYYIEAAENACTIMAFEQSIIFYKKAIKLSDLNDINTDNELRKLWQNYAIVLADSGHSQEAAHAYLKLVDGAVTAEKLNIQRIAGGLLLRSGHMDEGIDVMEKILKTLKIRLPKTPVKILLSLVYRRFLLRLRGLSFKSKDISQISAENYEKVEIFHSITDGMGIADVIKGADLGTRWVHAALNVGEPRQVLEALSREVNYIASSGNYGSTYTHKILSAINRILEKVDYPVISGYMHSADAYRHYMSGNYSLALKAAEDSIKVFENFNSYYWERAQMSFVVVWSLFYLGELDDMSHRAEIMLDNANERDDLLAFSGNFLGLPNIAYMDKYGVENAELEVEKLIRRWTTKGYHLQHYWYLLNRFNINTYNGNFNTSYNLIHENWNILKKSLLLLLPSIGNESVYMKARAALGIYRENTESRKKSLLREAVSGNKKLLRSSHPWNQGISHFLSSQIFSLKGDDDSSVQELKLAIDHFDSFEMKLHANTGRHKAGMLIGGDEGKELMDTAQIYFSKQSFRDPERLTGLIVY
ncbi:MAG: protein kinase [Deltaproteobacteria bacterium]|nr:protein kinase [Deltaproteobacteria bacterium]